MNDTIIFIVLIVVLLTADFGIRVYLKKKEVTNGTDEEKKETNEELLKDFLTLMKSISTECIDAITSEANMTKEEYEDVLAKKILSVFKETVSPHYEGTNIGVIINSLPEDFIIQWIKNNVFNIDEVFKAKNITPKVPQVNIIRQINEANKEE